MQTFNRHSLIYTEIGFTYAAAAGRKRQNSQKPSLRIRYSGRLVANDFRQQLGRNLLPVRAHLARRLVQQVQARDLHGCPGNDADNGNEQSNDGNQQWRDFGEQVHVHVFEFNNTRGGWQPLG